MIFDLLTPRIRLRNLSCLWACQGEESREKKKNLKAEEESSEQGSLFGIALASCYWLPGAVVWLRMRSVRHTVRCEEIGIELLLIRFELSSCQIVAWDLRPSLRLQVDDFSVDWSHWNLVVRGSRSCWLWLSTWAAWRTKLKTKQSGFWEEYYEQISMATQIRGKFVSGGTRWGWFLDSKLSLGISPTPNMWRQRKVPLSRFSWFFFSLLDFFVHDMSHPKTKSTMSKLKVANNAKMHRYLIIYWKL